MFPSSERPPPQICCISWTCVSGVSEGDTGHGPRTYLLLIHNSSLQQQQDSDEDGGSL